MKSETRGEKLAFLYDSRDQLTTQVNLLRSMSKSEKSLGYTYRSVLLKAKASFLNAYVEEITQVLSLTHVNMVDRMEKDAEIDRIVGLLFDSDKLFEEFIGGVK